MARRERLQNNSTTTLNGGLDASTTSVAVTDGSVFPSEGDYRIIIDSEIMLVTARSTNTLTVTRAAESTVAATHANAADVTLILTEDAVESYVRQTVPFHGYSPALRIYNTAGAIIDEGDFTWVNQSTATSTDVNNAILVKLAATTGANFNAKVISSSSAPYAMIGCIHMLGPIVTEAVGQPRAGLVFRESGTGEMISFCARKRSDGGGVQLVVQRWTDATTFSAEQHSEFFALSQERIWLRIEDDNTDLNFSISADGVNWMEIYTESRTAFMAGGPDQVGFGGNANTSAGTDSFWFYLLHFSEE